MKPIVLGIICAICVVLMSSCKQYTTSPPDTSCAILSTLASLKPGSYWIFTRELTEPQDTLMAANKISEDSMAIIALLPNSGKGANAAIVMCDWSWNYQNQERVLDTTYWTIMDNQIWSSAVYPEPYNGSDSSMKWRLLYDCNDQGRTIANVSKNGDSARIKYYDSLSNKPVERTILTKLTGANVFSFDGLSFISTVGSTHDQAEQFSSMVTWQQTMEQPQDPKAVFISDGLSSRSYSDTRTMQFVQDNGLICSELRVNRVNDKVVSGQSNGVTKYALNYRRTLKRFHFVQ